MDLFLKTKTIVGMMLRMFLFGSHFRILEGFLEPLPHQEQQLYLPIRKKLKSMQEYL